MTTPIPQVKQSYQSSDGRIAVIDKVEPVYARPLRVGHNVPRYRPRVTEYNLTYHYIDDKQPHCNTASRFLATHKLMGE